MMGRKSLYIRRDGTCIPVGGKRFPDLSSFVNEVRAMDAARRQSEYSSAAGESALDSIHLTASQKSLRSSFNFSPEAKSSS